MKISSRKVENQSITDTELEEAIKRGHRRLRTEIRATQVRYLADYSLLLLTFEDGSGVALPIRDFPELASLSTAELSNLRLGFGGAVICHDGRDVHVSVGGLIKSTPSLMKLALSLSAGQNGGRTSALKAAAARINGLKGGRPRKEAGSVDYGGSAKDTGIVDYGSAAHVIYSVFDLSGMMRESPVGASRPEKESEAPRSPTSEKQTERRKPRT